MTSILSSISGYFTRSLILGTVLPVVIFMVLGMLFLVPLLPSDLRFLAPLEGIDKQWKVIAASFIAIVISGLIYNLNIPILRWYEGYPWKNSWIGQWSTRRHKKKFDAAQNRLASMRATRLLMEQTSKQFDDDAWRQEFFDSWRALHSPLGESNISERKWEDIWQTAPSREEHPSLSKLRWTSILNNLISRYSEYRYETKILYPEERGLILPTRLGNVIRSFEFYPRREYGMDSVALWPRLIAVIPKDYAVSVDEAKTAFDFMLNCSVLSFFLGISILLAGLVYPVLLTSSTRLRYWLIEVVVFTFLSYFFYRLSINRVGAWGSMVKGAFDLYRWELLKKLGYKQEPETRQAERNLWGEISRQIIYGDRFDGSIRNYADKTITRYPSLHSVPAKTELRYVKGITTDAASEVVTFYVSVKNTSTNFAEADITVADHLADDFEYQWQSAEVGGVKVPVFGGNPYQFEVGHLLPQGELVLKYNAIPRRKGSSRET